MVTQGSLGYRTPRFAVLFLLPLIVACQSAPPAGEAAPPAAPAASAPAPSRGAPLFVVDSAASEIRLLVYRAGPLARFGHNHVVTGLVHGEIRAGRTAAESGFRLEVPVESLVVDSAEARAEEGKEFAAEVSAQAREGTRDHMLGAEVLDATRYPLIRIESISLSGPRWNPTVLARTTLRGVTHELRFPAAVVQDGDRVTVIASLQIRQSDFGITPFAALGGGLRVRDEVDIRVRVVARHGPQPGSS